MANHFKYLYGPVHSWRLGRSLGIDPLSHPQKICNMNCVYCQLGLTGHLTQARRDYVPADEVIEEVSRLPLHFIDYLTFSGRGEPTLARNLGQMIRGIKAVRREHVAVITNSSLLGREDVQDDLKEADFVLAKLDAISQESFKHLNGGNLNFSGVLEGLFDFRRCFKGKFALQIMLIEENLNLVAELAAVARNLAPSEVQLNTPLRPCAVNPIERIEMQWAKKFFGDLPVVTAWDTPQKPYMPFDQEATSRRHGDYVKTRYSL